MRALHYSVVFVEKGKALNFQNSFCPHSHLYGHESWVMTERVRSQVLAESKELHCLTRCVALRFETINIEPLLLRIERSQLRWFGHVSRMPQERLSQQALLEKASERIPVGQPRSRWTDCNGMELFGTSSKQSDGCD